ncbi:DeoR/GlpR family DNA-binding transcription regulator [Nonomuraea sp. SYSU D8015]|uniref:DeoR/GlpR family DNA-binding transcription regulator n=1 Tax=Nonomuraea sp. SYSU D8015 TaxID=2593644 RepID=UPI001660E4E7|nr:DeoR/GlpR family DNA-binding transcription regulator [Nonomuraea sp. SYSU D8015]
MGEPGPMLIAERRRRILEHVHEHGYASFQELAGALGTSESTVRRDLRSLVGEGLLHATRGGVTRPVLSAASRPALPDTAAAEREAIADHAATLVEPGTAVLLGPGRTTAALARRLAKLPSLTVVTNSTLVVEALMGAPHIEVVAVGGTLRRSIHAFVGPITEQHLEGLRGAQTFLSGDGVTPERGLTTPNVFAAATDQAFAAAAREVVVLADHSKIGHDTMCQTVATERMRVLVTDSKADPVMVDRLVQAQVDVHIADMNR